MLIKCPECNHDVSDTAVNCPHCGYSIKDNIEEIRVKIDEQEEKAAAEKAEKEQREAENRRRFSKWIKRSILATVAVFVIVLIGERIYLSKYHNYKETMKFIKALEISIKNDSSSIRKEYPNIELTDIQEITHINYEVKARPEDPNDDFHYAHDFYYVKTSDDIYTFYYIDDLSDGFALVYLDNYSMDSKGVYYYTYKAADKAYSQYCFGADKTDDYNYDEQIEMSDYNLLVTRLYLLIDNPKPSK